MDVRRRGFFISGTTLSKDTLRGKGGGPYLRNEKIADLGRGGGGDALSWVPSFRAKSKSRGEGNASTYLERTPLGLRGGAANLERSPIALFGWKKKREVGADDLRKRKRCTRFQRGKEISATRNRGGEEREFGGNLQHPKRA